MVELATMLAYDALCRRMPVPDHPQQTGNGASTSHGALARHTQAPGPAHHLAARTVACGTDERTT